MKQINSHQALIIVLSFLAPTIGQGSGIANPPKAVSDLDHAFIEAAEANKIDVKWLRAMCWVESSHKIKAKVIFDQKNLNKKGATSYGVCQIQYNTAKFVGFKGDAKQLMNTHTNVYYAAKVLKYWLNKAKGNYRLAVSAYNRGHYRRTMRIAYVCKVLIALQENR